MCINMHINELIDMESARRNSLSSLSLTNNKLKLSSNIQELPKHHFGFYWIYTKYSMSEIINCTPSTHSKSVKLNIIANQNSHLNNTCRIIEKFNNENYTLVYNGIGGGLTGGAGLRERLLAEFGFGSNKTGSLAIRGSSLYDLSKWIYSFKIVSESFYRDNAKMLERIWRIHYGWPLLCRS